MNQREFLINKLDTVFKVQCSDSKTGDYTYKKIDEALEHNFLRFGNSYFIPAVSIDIDNSQDILINDIIKTNKLPDPTFVVETSRGYHIHWFLSNPIKTSNVKQLRKLRETLLYLQKLFGADKFATTTSSGRVWRNPIKHSNAFTDTTVELNDLFTTPELPKNTREFTKSINRYKKFLNTDFSKVLEGERNTTLFDYGRAYAYTTGVINVFDELCTKNDTLLNPLPISEVTNIASSIEIFMSTKYKKGAHTTSEATIAFNRRVAAQQADKKVLVIFEKSLKLLTIPIIAVQRLSARKGAEVFKISKDTFLKHKKIVLKKLVSYFKSLVKTINKWVELQTTNFKVLFEDINVLHWDRHFINEHRTCGSG
jgi:hypothetical protein